jgi:predicted membrane protein
MHRRHRSPGIWPGFILVLVGAGLLAREFGLIPHHVRVVDFWPVFIMVMGLSGLVRARGFMSGFFSLAFIAMGGLLLAGNFGMIAFPAARLWPVLLVVLGLSFIVRGRYRRGFRSSDWRLPDGPGGGEPGGGGWGGTSDGGSSGGDDGAHTTEVSSHQHHFQTTDADRLQKQYTFSGAQIKIESQSWKGGELGVTAGGVELDLRHAGLAPEGAVLDVRVVMGGVDIRVPDTWKVNCDVTPLFGGADDTTRTTQGATDAPRLRVVGTVTLGGVTVRN